MLSFLSFSGIAAYLYDAIAYLSVRLVILSAILTIAHRCGYLHRLLWYVAESECTKLVNYVPTTIGRLDHVDLWRGEFALSNVVIHSPSAATTTGNNGRKNLWTSPVIARIGTVRVSVNAIQCLCAKWFLGEEIPIDFYAIYISDVQVFVERRYNVYNFFLLDPNIILPDAFVRAAAQAADQFDDDDDENTGEHPDDERAAAAEQEQLQQALLRGNHSDINNADRRDSIDVTTTTTTRAAVPTKATSSTNMAASSSSCSFSTMTTTESPLHQQHDNNTTTTTTTQQQQQTAAAIVDDMLDAVKRAALAGSATTLVSHYKDRLQESLKRFERRQRIGSSSSGGGNDNNTATTKKTSQTAAAAALVETVELLKNVGANITHKTELAQRAVLPTRRPNPHVVYGRIGRLDIVDLRIFPHHHYDADAASVVANIHVQGISMKPSELCGPASSSSSSSSSFDGNHNNSKPQQQHHPFAKMDDLIELVTKRVVSEMAKSDAGKFLQTAMQEVADALKERS